MTHFVPNKFISNLAAICRENLLAEKWLLAPNRRVGNQWAEQVARSGQPAVNLRVTTVRSLVLELSGSAPGKLISHRGAEILVSRVLNALRDQAPRYFTTLEPFPSLVSALTRSIEDLRTAGISAEELRDTGTSRRWRDRLRHGDAGTPRPGSGQGGKSAKMAELADLLTGYENGLAEMGRVDYGGLLSAVTDDFRSGTGRWPEGRMLLTPDDLELRGLENTLMDLLPAVIVQGLKPGEPSPSGDRELTDLARLAWMDTPLQAPPKASSPQDDGTLEILGASGEINEARLALRKCLSRTWPLDQVEILYTDGSTYLPLLFELFARHFPFETGDLDNLPATFSEGIPSVYSRPGKALGAWARWAMDGYPVQGLAGMVREGLLRFNGESSQAERAAAADLLCGTGAGPGPGAALAAVEAAMEALKGRSGNRYDEDGDALPDRGKDLAVLDSLQNLLTTLQGCTPLPGHSLSEVLEGAACFLETTVRTAGQFDEYAAKALARDIDETLKNIGELSHFPEGDPLAWIVSFIQEVRVAGSGPRPGRLHVAPLALGGHSGRPHTVVLGLDDGRFPGSDRQEPVLLDSEREALSPLLRVSGEELKAREISLIALAGRVRGTLTLACCLRDLVEDRDTFPSPSLVKAYRILSDPRADQEALLNHLSPPAGFIDPAGGISLDSAQWWTERFTRPGRVIGGSAALGRRFPNLGRGMAASEEKRRPVVTPFDGLTGPLPPELDILSELGPAASSNRLQTLGACPLRYFFKYILDIKGVDEEAPEPGKWLTPSDRGSILHELFQLYMDGLIRAGKAPDYDRDSAGLEKLLDGLLDRHGREAPPPTSHARDHEREQMMESARIFLREEESFTRDHEPLYAEASLGLPSTDLPTGLDRAEPVSLELAPGRRVRARGRIDRIDRRKSDGAFVITDYKSGSNWLYTRKDPFNQGRVVQHLFYVRMAESCLARSAGHNARVVAFRYLFPTAQAQGEAVLLARETLEDGREVLAHLCDLAGSGCFVATDDAGDCKWCDYALVCGDTASQALRVAAKLAGDDPALDPMRKLRGYE
ncbi:MAG: PD-(D/E)XK nuclease family protein [bacterium]|nr:PD-(D/E)XK nuclease family protein [bacterium]